MSNGYACASFLEIFMNDFTKEELIILKRLTLQNVNWLRENSACIDLNNKIQSIIDNYYAYPALEPLGTIEGGKCDRRRIEKSS